MKDILPETDIGAPGRGINIDQLSLDGVLALEEFWRNLEVEFVATQLINGFLGKQPGQVFGPEDTEDTSALLIWMEDVEAEEACRAFFKGAVGVPGEFAQRVRDGDGFLACAFGVDAFGLELYVPECSLCTAVCIGLATHPVDEVEDELAVRVRPVHLNSAYTVFSEGVGVHFCHGQADLTIRCFEEAAKGKFELGRFGRCAFLGDEGVVGGHFAKVVELLEGSIFAGGHDMIRSHSERT